MKPDNLLATEDGDFKLGDLGLCVFEGRSARTPEGTFVGTPGYMPPERFLDQTAMPTPAYDLYGATILFIEAVTGKVPFDGDDPASIIQDQLRRKFNSRHLRDMGFPPYVARVLAESLVNSPSQRRSSARTMLDDLVAATEATETAVLAGTALVEKQARQPRKGNLEQSAKLAVGQETVVNLDEPELPRTQLVETRPDFLTTATKPVQLPRTRRFLAALTILLCLGLGYHLVTSRLPPGREGPSRNTRELEQELYALRDDILGSADQPPRDATARLGKLIHQTGAGRRLSIEPEVLPEVAGLYCLGSHCKHRKDFERMLSFFFTLLERYGPVATGLPEAISLDHLVDIAEQNNVLTTLAPSLAARSRATTDSPQLRLQLAYWAARLYQRRWTARFMGAEDYKCDEARQLLEAWVQTIEPFVLVPSESPSTRQVLQTYLMGLTEVKTPKSRDDYASLVARVEAEPRPGVDVVEVLCASGDLHYGTTRFTKSDPEEDSRKVLEYLRRALGKARDEDQRFEVRVRIARALSRAYEQEKARQLLDDIEAGGIPTGRRWRLLVTKALILKRSYFFQKAKKLLREALEEAPDTAKAGIRKELARVKDEAVIFNEK